MSDTDEFVHTNLFKKALCALGFWKDFKSIVLSMNTHSMITHLTEWNLYF